jgi:hypothetical protein
MGLFPTKLQQFGGVLQVGENAFEVTPLHPSWQTRNATEDGIILLALAMLLLGRSACLAEEAFIGFTGDKLKQLFKVAI